MYFVFIWILGFENVYVVIRELDSVILSVIGKY